MQAEGEPPTLDLLRARLDDPRLAEAALKLQEVGRANPDPAGTLRLLLAEFRRVAGKETILFDAEARDYYALEDLWADATKVDWERA